MGDKSRKQRHSLGSLVVMKILSSALVVVADQVKLEKPGKGFCSRSRGMGERR